jgi:RNA polymerase sigma factor (sigma-70 family)
MTSEIELLRASLNGSSDAFEAIVKKYQSLICAITYSATGDLDKSEDLAQQAFVNAWKNLAQLKDLASFRTWLCSIARSIIRNYFRSQKRDIISHAASIEEVAPDLPDNFEPVEAAIGREQEQVIRHALNQIPESYREPLVLYYREQKSLKQVAEQLQLSEGAARQRISRGRSMLREHVAAMIETTLSRNGPTAAFTAAVVASIGAMAVKTSSAAAAAASTTGVTGTGAAVTAAASGMTAKIITVAAVLAIGAAAVITYKRVTSQTERPQPTDTVPNIAQPDTSAAPDRIDAGTDITPDDIPAQSKTATAPATMPPARNIDTIPALPQTETKEFVFQPKGVLSGLITDAETNEPVVGARVQISKPRRYTSVTDENGFYHIDRIDEDGDYKVRVRSTEYLWVSNWSEEPVLTLKNGTRAVRHFALKPGCQIDVDIVDEHGKPIENTRLFVSWMGVRYGRELERERWNMQTDCNGQATLGAFEPADVEYLCTAMHDD